MNSINRQVCFNELSFFDKENDEDALKLFTKFAETIKGLTHLGFHGVKYEYGISSLSKESFRNIFDYEHYSIFQYLVSTARSPYIDPDTEAEEKYVNNDYEVLIIDSWKDGEGFVAAYLLDTVAISLATHEKWQELSFTVRNKQSNERGIVLNVCEPHLSEYNDLLKFIEDRTPIILQKCSILPEKKTFHVRDDHGIDKLRTLWKRLQNFPYVISVINSLEFNPGKRWIEDCFDDGKIHIRLVDSDKGYGMVIQTTGKNLRETNAIAEILDREYFKGRFKRSSDETF